MTEKLQAVIGRMQEQIVALTTERDGAREQRDTARAELAAAEARIGEMVKIAGGTGEGCPTCKGTHMVSGTHGLDACPVCRPEPAKEFFPVAPSCHHVRALRCEKCGSIPTIPVVLCCSCVDRLFTPAQPGEGGA